MIQTLSFDHKGGFYFYRVHNKKLGICNGHDGLRSYLDKMFYSCPDEFFNEGPRSSALKFNLPVDLKMITGHEISMLTREALKVNKDRFKAGHSKVQVFLLEMDDKTIACEVPIWLNHEELKNFNELFNSNLPLTGHIDLIRIEDEKIWIWDYKPGSFEEKFASTQVFFYALMLSKRTGIPLDKFRCGYFDENYAFVFKPEEKLLERESIKQFI